MKSTQGSIEVAAIARVNDVNEWGEYIICSSEQLSLSDIGDAIKLKILRSQAVKTEYSLDDLRDLESKLVLITGKQTAGKSEADKFLNVCIVLIVWLYLHNKTNIIEEINYNFFTLARIM